METFLWISRFSVIKHANVLQVSIFLDRLQGEPIGFSVLGFFVIEKNTIVTVCETIMSNNARRYLSNNNKLLFK